MTIEEENNRSHINLDKLRIQPSQISILSKEKDEEAWNNRANEIKNPWVGWK